MNNNTYTLSESDAETWQRYITRMESVKEFTPLKHIYGTEDLSRRLDLHGMTVHEAWGKLREFAEQHADAGTHDIVVITGRSGQIAYEFTEWCRRIPAIRRYEAIETRGGKVGSYRLYLKRKAVKT